MQKSTTKSQYHHGDLRANLIKAANEMIEQSGIESLSLRKLANHVGVSRTAPYHHFKDKNDLLCAIAEQGFQKWLKRFEKESDLNQQQNQTGFKQYMQHYVKFAKEHPELYELMFGRTIWKNNGSTAELKATAYRSFQYQVSLISQWQKSGLLDKDSNTLRLAQVIWGTLHGIAKLYIDGVYTQESQISQICDCAAEQFIQHD